MNRATTLVFQGLTLIVSLAVLAFLIWEPTVEGRNEGASLFQTYLTDPFLAYVYVGSIAFAAMFNVFRFWGFAGGERMADAIKALRRIRLCALVLAAFVAGALGMILLMTGEDRAGGVFICGVALLGSLGLAGGAWAVERWLRGKAEG